MELHHISLKETDTVFWSVSTSRSETMPNMSQHIHHFFHFISASYREIRIRINTVCLPLGIGIGMLCVSMLVCLYYNVIIAWTFYYLGSSFQSPLPWSCDAVANAGLCGNSTTGDNSTLSPTEIFWK